MVISLHCGKSLFQPPREYCRYSHVTTIAAYLRRSGSSGAWPLDVALGLSAAQADRVNVPHSGCCQSIFQAVETHHGPHSNLHHVIPCGSQYRGCTNSGVALRTETLLAVHSARPSIPTKKVTFLPRIGMGTRDSGRLALPWGNRLTSSLSKVQPRSCNL